MKDILVILTGGTIGSCIKNGSINIDNSSKCMVVEKYKELYEKLGLYEQYKPQIFKYLIATAEHG